MYECVGFNCNIIISKTKINCNCGISSSWFGVNEWVSEKNNQKYFCDLNKFNKAYKTYTERQKGRNNFEPS
jgi:hypothetical protein